MFDKWRIMWHNAEWEKAKAATRKRLDHRDQLMGRPSMWLHQRVSDTLRDKHITLPQVIRDDETGTATIPDTYLGLVSYVARWDGLMADGELANFMDLVKGMTPMGIIVQDYVSHHSIPDDWKRRQSIGP